MFKFLINLFNREEKISEEIIPVSELHGKFNFSKPGSSSSYYSSLSTYYSKVDLDKIHNAYFRKYPKGKHNDLIWMIYNQLTLDYTRANDWFKLSQVYRDMAVFVYADNKDPFVFLHNANKYTLKDVMTNTPIEVKAVISACDDACTTCKTQNRSLYTLKEAIQLMPIPHKNCTHNGKKTYSFCRCGWNFVSDED